jgi:hypothetical protein
MFQTDRIENRLLSGGVFYLPYCIGKQGLGFLTAGQFREIVEEAEMNKNFD